METTLIEIPTFNSVSASSIETATKKNAPKVSELDAKTLAFDLGIWLSGLESFLNIRNHSLADESRTKVSVRDWTKEFHLTHSTLLLCSSIAFRLVKALKKEAQETEEDVLNLDFEAADLGVLPEEVFEIGTVLRDAVLLSEGLLRAAPLKFGEWTAWSNSLSDRFTKNEAFQKIIAFAEKTASNSLPEELQKLIQTKNLSFSADADLHLILPHFAKILRWLGVIEKMLERDEPLKPSLLIFSRIREQIGEMMLYVDSRLLRFTDESDELFGALDGAAYAASIELKKVFNHELAGLSEIRQAPQIYAKIETAFSLLNDSFQLTLINFAKLFDPKVEPHDIFPQIKEKFEQSIVLRRELWQVMQEVKKAEESPENYPLAQLHIYLTNFIAKPLQFLFYKDRETVERFVEEVLLTNDKKDLVPILHRFGAYLETLFGQVNMRIVLANSPFEAPKDE